MMMNEEREGLRGQVLVLRDGCAPCFVIVVKKSVRSGAQKVEDT